MTAEIVWYQDPERLHLAEICSIYLGKTDKDNVKRPLTLIRKEHTSVLRHVSFRVHFSTSIIVRDQLFRYTTAQMAASGLRGNEAQKAIYIRENAVTDDPFKLYKKALAIHMKKEDARYYAPCGTIVDYVMTINFLTAIHILEQRLWIPGAQNETRETVQEIWRQLLKYDKELWETVYEVYGPHRHKLLVAMKKLMKSQKGMEKIDKFIAEYGEEKTMWE